MDSCVSGRSLHNKSSKGSSLRQKKKKSFYYRIIIAHDSVSHTIWVTAEPKEYILMCSIGGIVVCTATRTQFQGAPNLKGPWGESQTETD